MDKLSKTISLPSYSVERDWLYAPKTYLTDSFSPFVEEIYLPSVASDAGSVKLKIVEHSEANVSSHSWIKKLISRNSKKIQVEDNVILDLREYSPANLAHAITIHLPIALYVSEYLSSNGFLKPLLIFPKKLPAHVQKLFSELGFQFLLTDGTVMGMICNYELDSLTCLRSTLPELIKDSFSQSNLVKKLLDASINQPKKIFISRRDTRRLNNEDEVEQFLIKKGFQKLYLEDYSVIEQIALVSLADSIVAIHGAALGPLIFRTLFNKPPLKLVELFTPAHMSNVYRIVMHQIGGKWISVRGKAWPKLMEQAYECEIGKVRQYSLLDFELCMTSLQLAMEKIEL